MTNIRAARMNLSQLTPDQKETRKRILEISYHSGLSHLGSCLSAVDIIDTVYRVKRKDECFVLSGGHGAVALYAVLEEKHVLQPSAVEKLHIHPDRNVDCGIDASTGSLGQGLPIAVGMALADKNKRIFCLISDGECAEGSIWEAFRIIYENKIRNLIAIINANGWGAYGPIFLPALLNRLKGFGLHAAMVDGHNINKLSNAIKTAGARCPSIIFARTNVEQFPFLKGQDAHYHVMSKEEYKLAMEMLR